MRQKCRTIPSLVALGRITPAEAQRLLMDWNIGQEELWTLFACIAIACLAQLHPHTALPVDSVTVHRALSLITHLFGGIV